MQSPRAEWVLFGIHFAVLDYLRNRGEPDGDTVTEVVRVVFHVDRPAGRFALAGALTGAGIGLYRHFTKPEMRAYLRKEN